jgi:hypothetical protein
VYQQNTQLVDEHLLDALGGRARLSADDAIDVSRQMIQLSLQKYPAALATQFHVDPFELGGAGAEAAGRWLEGTLEQAAANGVPILSAQQWLSFTEARHDAQMSGVAWNAGQASLALDVSAPETPGGGLELLIPIRNRDRLLRQVRVDASEATSHERRLGDTLYAAIRVPGGRHRIDATYTSG